MIYLPLQMKTVLRVTHPLHLTKATSISQVRKSLKALCLLLPARSEVVIKVPKFSENKKIKFQSCTSEEMLNKMKTKSQIFCFFIYIFVSENALTILYQEFVFKCGTPADQYHLDTSFNKPLSLYCV